MAAFECVKSPGGTGFGGTSSRFARLPSRDGLVSAKNYGSPGPGAYDTPSVIGFDRSALSGVTASFSQSSFMLGSRTSSMGTRSGLAGGSGEPHEVSAPLQTSVGQSHYLSQHGSSASYSIGSRFPRQRARTPGPLAYRAPSVAEVRGAVMGTDDRFGPTEGHSVKYATTPGATAYDPMHPLPTTASYTFGNRFERKPVSRSPGPAADGSPQDAKLAVLSRPANFSMGIKTATRPPRTPEMPSLHSYDARSEYWNGKKALGRSRSLEPLPAPRDLNLHKPVQAAQSPGPAKRPAG